MTQHRLNLGESLSTIAHQELGDFRRWREIADQNNLDIFQALPVGQDIRIPSPQDLERLARERLGEAARDLARDAIASRTNGRAINDIIKLISFLY